MPEGCGCPDDVCALEEFLAALVAAKEEGKSTPQVITPEGIHSEERVMPDGLPSV